MPKRLIYSCISKCSLRPPFGSRDVSDARRSAGFKQAMIRERVMGRISPRSGIVWLGKATPAAFVKMVQAPNETSALKTAIGQFNIRREDQSCAKRPPTEVAY
jgi:hypothetical protein